MLQRQRGPGGTGYLCRLLPSGPGSGGEGEVPGVARDLPGRGGGLDGHGGRPLRGLARKRAEVRQRQGDGPDVVDPQQNLQGADLLETLVGQSFAGPLDLLDARRERAEPASCRQRQSFTPLASFLSGAN